MRERFSLGAYEYDEFMDVTVAVRSIRPAKASLPGAKR